MELIALKAALRHIYTGQLPVAYLWHLCRTQHQLALPCIHLDQSPAAGLSVLLQLLFLSLLYVLVAGRVVIGSLVMAVAVSLRQCSEKKSKVKSLTL